MLVLAGKLVSQAKGEYAGPCPFKGIGVDRFHWFSGAKNWWCRKECPDCPGKPHPYGGMTGWFKDDECDTGKARPPRKTSYPSMSRVYGYHDHLDPQVLAYLATRGIRSDTAHHFWVGKNCRRLTIPCIARVCGKPTCFGIKKRWIGKPPEDWINTYTMEVGSTGRAIFNYPRLISRNHWSHFLIVEGILDCMLLDQMAIPAVAPFGGGGVWDAKWETAFRHVKNIIIVADNDIEEQGLGYAQRKVDLLGRGLVALPPGLAKDIGEAHLAGENIRQWLEEIKHGNYQP